MCCLSLPSSLLQLSLIDLNNGKNEQNIDMHKHFKIWPTKTEEVVFGLVFQVTSHFFIRHTCFLYVFWFLPIVPQFKIIGLISTPILSLNSAWRHHTNRLKTFSKPFAPILSIVAVLHTHSYCRVEPKPWTIVKSFYPRKEVIWNL